MVLIDFMEGIYGICIHFRVDWVLRGIRVIKMVNPILRRVRWTVELKSSVREVYEKARCIASVVFLLE